MSQRFRNALRHFAGAVMLAVVLAGVVCVATSGFTKGAKFSNTPVDRMHKGDRLLAATSRARPEINSKTTKTPTIVPSGCDPAFSPVADPERERIFGRCVT
jgi:hypothetical protein